MDQEMHARVAQNTLSFLFDGQPISEWPNWMTFQNYATDAGLTKIVIHGWLEKHTVHRGDTVERKQDGSISVTRKKILNIAYSAPKLIPEPPASGPAFSQPSTEMMMSL